MTGPFDDAARSYDAVLVVSFGGPEGPEDVSPFLDNVLRGLDVPPRVKAAIARRYDRFGGVSQINAETRAFVDALRSELVMRGPALPVYLGNRNWDPLLKDTMRTMAAEGVRRAIACITSVFGSYNGCRKYREDLFEASQVVEDPPVIDRLRLGFNHPGFIEAMAGRVRAALERLPTERRPETALVFTAHSLPEAMAKLNPYQAQLAESCALVASTLGHHGWELAYQSRNAPYGEPWLGPEISEAFMDARKRGVKDVIVAPIGFVSDHLEVVLDLDIEARAKAEEIGLNFIRAATVGAHPAYVRMMRDLIIERMTVNPARPALGSMGPAPDVCRADCCLSGRTASPKPALCGTDAPA